MPELAQTTELRLLRCPDFSSLGRLLCDRVLINLLPSCQAKKKPFCLKCAMFGKNATLLSWCA